ncbi:MAG TPA: glycerophosphodiester phosphodiesterase [Candidatus Brachybacterium merdigallinarum]|nr:glycerophosphodiester phosphodiesterase [Candidatus Brachybacterium merdigallinarum]
MHSSTASTADPLTRFLPGARPRRIAHRGLSPEGAENTLAAFGAALEAGADLLETDVRATADGVAWLLHDETLQRIAQDPRPVAELTGAQMREVRVAGIEPVSRLEDALGEFPDAQFNIDVKVPEAIASTVTAIARTGSAERICLTSFHGSVAADAVARVQAATGILPARSPSRGAMAAFLAARALELPAACLARLLAPYGALQVPPRYPYSSRWAVPIVTEANIAAAHRAGVEVHVWTVDEPAAMRDLLVSGVDGIITNRVDLLTELLEGTAPTTR